MIFMIGITCVHGDMYFRYALVWSPSISRSFSRQRLHEALHACAVCSTCYLVSGWRFCSVGMNYFEVLRHRPFSELQKHGGGHRHRACTKRGSSLCRSFDNIEGISLG